MGADVFGDVCGHWALGVVGLSCKESASLCQTQTLELGRDNKHPNGTGGVRDEMALT